MYCDKTPTKDKIKIVLSNFSNMLIEKNNRYGNSALNPLEVFTGKTQPLGLGVRLDDKISRIKNSKELRKNDVADLMGYLTLLCVNNGWTDFQEFID